MRTRVERLLRGDFRPDDLTRLFVYVRDRSDGRESIQEIGDFTAHHSERSKGLITRTTRDWFLTVQFTVGKRRTYGLQQLPANFREVMRASLRRLPHEVIEEKTGMSKVAATKMLPSFA